MFVTVIFVTVVVVTVVVVTVVNTATTVTVFAACSCLLDTLLVLKINRFRDL